MDPIPLGRGGLSINAGGGGEVGGNICCGPPPPPPSAAVCMVPMGCSEAVDVPRNRIPPPDAAAEEAKEERGG